MNVKREDMLPLLATLVLFTALVNPLVTMIISGASLVGLLLYRLRRRPALR
jgi:hypothetical protein